MSASEPSGPLVLKCPMKMGPNYSIFIGCLKMGGGEVKGVTKVRSSIKLFSC